MTYAPTLSERRQATLARRQGLATTQTTPARARRARPQRGAQSPRVNKRSSSRGAGRSSSVERRPMLRPARDGHRGARLGFAVGRPDDVARTLGPPTGTYYVIASILAVFVVLGLVMVLSASALTQANAGNSPYAVFYRQAMWAGFGLVGLIVAAKVPYNRWRPVVALIGIGGVALMAGVFVPGLGVTINGANSWIRIGPLSMQPSEVLKLVIVIVAADYLTRRSRDLGDTRATLVPVGLLTALGAAMCLAQGDLGSAIVLGAIVLSVAWIAGVPAKPLAGFAAVAAVAAIGFVVSSPRRISRFTAFLDIEGHKEYESYQVYQGLVSIANGGLTGSGIGGSRTKLGYLPYAHSDFIFSIIADELGMIGTAAVIGGFIVLVAFGIQTALAAPDRFGMLLAGGISSWFGVQAVINLGGVTGVMPVTGLTLPFFSAGGSSLFVSMVAGGMLLSVARRVIRS